MAYPSNSALCTRATDAQNQRVMDKLVPASGACASKPPSQHPTTHHRRRGGGPPGVVAGVFEGPAGARGEHCPQWKGFGLAMPRPTRPDALELIRHLTALARRYRVRLMCLPAWSRAHIGTPRSSARRAGPARLQCSRTNAIPTSPSPGRAWHLPQFAAQRGHHCRHPANGRQDGAAFELQRLHWHG